METQQQLIQLHGTSWCMWCEYIKVFHELQGDRPNISQSGVKRVNWENFYYNLSAIVI